MIEIAILSGKGGTGKSSISAALASLASKIVVADCDVDAANLHLVLSPENYREEIYISGQKAILNQKRCTRCGACLEHCRFEAVIYDDGVYKIRETACDGCQLCSRVCPSNAITMIAHDKSRWFAGNILNGKMIHARLSPGEDNSGKLVNIVREQARVAADEINSSFILIDGPPGIGCPAISALTGADKVVLVTEPTQSGLHDLKRVTELAMMFKGQIYIVINKHDINPQISNEIEEWSELMQIPVIGKIPFDTIFIDAMINCTSIVNWDPTSTISDEIRSIWNKLFQPKTIDKLKYVNI